MQKKAIKLNVFGYSNCRNTIGTQQPTVSIWFSNWQNKANSVKTAKYYLQLHLFEATTVLTYILRVIFTGGYLPLEYSHSYATVSLCLDSNDYIYFSPCFRPIVKQPLKSQDYILHFLTGSASCVGSYRASFKGTKYLIKHWATQCWSLELLLFILHGDQLFQN